MLTIRGLSIINFLLENDNLATREALASLLHVSPKTISREIQSLQLLTKQNSNLGFMIETKPGIGIYLNIIDALLFNDFYEQQKDNSTIETNSELTPRAYELFTLLLTSDDFLSIETLSTQLFMSESSIYLELKQIRHLLRRYSLSLESQSTKGLRVIGKEMNIRLCMAHYLITDKIPDNTTLLSPISDINKIETIRSHVLTIFKKFDIKIHDKILHSFFHQLSPYHNLL